MAKGSQAVSDEQIVAALLANGTQKAAAAAVGVDERTIYNRMNNGEFQALYKSAKADLIRATVADINKQLQAAVNTIVDVMTDDKNNAAVRLQAAQTILNNAGKFSQQLIISESMVSTQINNNRWSI